MSAMKSILKPTPPHKRKRQPVESGSEVKRVKFDESSTPVVTKKTKGQPFTPTTGKAPKLKFEQVKTEQDGDSAPSSPATPIGVKPLNKKGMVFKGLIKGPPKKKGPESIKFGKKKKKIEGKMERKMKNRLEIVPSEQTPRKWFHGSAILTPGKKTPELGRKKKGVMSPESKDNTPSKSSPGSPGKSTQKLSNGPGSADQGQVKKTSKERKSELADKKRKRNPDYDLLVKVKQIWENVRRKDCSKLQRAELVVEMYNLVKDKLKEIIFTPDMVRVIECLMAVGTDEIKEQIFTQLKDNMLDLTKSKYSKFFMLKALKYGSKEQRKHIMKIFNGKLVELVRHSEASAVVECAYNEHANATERSAMVEEFYGPNYVLFKDADVKTLSQMFEKEPNKKESILTHMKDALLPIVEKSSVKHSIVHHVLYEYLMNCDPKARADMIESVRDIVVQILHTQDGARVGMQCIFHGTGKDRKTIIKSMKSHVVKICKEEHGHAVLLAIFDNVDDTVLIRNVILKELMLNALEVATDPHGRKVILYLLSPRDLRFFLPQVVNKFQKADGNEHSRKEPTRRHEELLQSVAQPLLQLVAAETSELIRNSSHSVVASTILQKCAHLGDPTEAYKAISAVVAEPFVPGNVEKYHIIEDPAGHMFIKRLIAADKDRYLDKQKVLFSEILLKSIPSGAIESWLDCNRGAFILVNLLETEVPSVRTSVTDALAPLHKKLKKKSYQAAKILLQKLKSE